MVAKKSTSTPQWGNNTAEPLKPAEDDFTPPAFLQKDHPKPRAPLPPIDTTPVPGQSAEEAARAAQIAERATRDKSAPVQTDLEDFTSSPAPSPAGDASASPSADAEAPQPSDATPAPHSGAVAEPPHDPETGEVQEREPTDAEIAERAGTWSGPIATAQGLTSQGGDGRELKPDDNQPRTATVVDADGTVAGKQLFSFIERYERLDEEKKALVDDQKEVLAEAKGNGFDTATIRRLIALRKLDPDVRAERESMLDLYKEAIGMV